MRELSVTEQRYKAVLARTLLTVDAGSPMRHPVRVAAPPVFTNESKPAEILEAAGRWLAEELGDDFRWTSTRHALQAVRGGRTYEVILQPSRWNRAGELTHASLCVTVRDKALAASRGHQRGAQVRKGSADVLWTCPVINIDPDIQD